MRTNEYTINTELPPHIDSNDAADADIEPRPHLKNQSVAKRQTVEEFVNAGGKITHVTASASAYDYSKIPAPVKPGRGRAIVLHKNVRER